MNGFSRHRKVISLELAPIEVALVRQFLAEMIALLEVEAGASRGDDVIPEAGFGSTADDSRTDADVIEDLERQFALDDAAVSTTDTAYAPDDPVLARLLPDAYPDDPQSSTEFRRFTQGGLVARKHANATVALASLDDAADDQAGGMSRALSADEAQAWLGALNDVRLALGVRLGVEQDDEARWSSVADDDPIGTVYHVYSWLGWLQETLVRALS